MSIIPESFPKLMKIQVIDTIHLADQMTNYYRSNGIPFFDVRDTLIKAKSYLSIYQKLDSHWNDNGSFIAYQSFCEQTYNQLGLTAFKRSDFNIKYQYTAQGDLTNMLGVDSIRGYSDSLPKYALKDTTKTYRYLNTEGYPNSTVITLNENCNNKLTVVMFRDSYSMAFIQYLSLHYYKVVYIWKSYSNKYINQEKPDVVISACAERYLRWL